MFSIPLASPFCIFYRTGLTPYPSSLNASNIRTLLAHRFHLLKLLVIINYILIVVKHNLLIILYEPFSLILVKKVLFFVPFRTYIDFNTSCNNIFFCRLSTCNSFTFSSTSYKKSRYDSYSHHIYLRYRHEFFLQVSDLPLQ